LAARDFTLDKLTFKLHHTSILKIGITIFFTQLGRVAAYLAFIIGALALGIGYEIGMADDVTKDGFKLGSMLMNSGFICILFAIIMGVLTDISKSLAKGVENK
jgi:hypothetical protein